MDYVFGTEGDLEILKTKGSTHTSLTGYQEVTREYPDQKITDSFHVVRHIGEATDGAGNCYDWYEIDRHNRIADRTGPVAAAVEETRTELENAMCEQDTAVQERLANIEDALCELDKN